MDLKIFSKKIKAYFRKKNNIDLVRDPLRDWMWLMSSFLILLVIIIAIAAYIFYMISIGKLFNSGSVDQGQSQIVKKAALSSVNDMYEAKEKALNALLPASSSSTKENSTLTATTSATSTATSTLDNSSNIVAPTE